MNTTVFYSWQSDLPAAVTRRLIENCLQAAVRQLAAQIDFRNLRLDHDTHKEPGSPEVVAAILKKIDQCSAFVADVSIVTPRRSTSRPIPNPNVLIELGYAAHSRGWDRVLFLCNEYFGRVERLPFDIRHRRLIPFTAKPGTQISAKLKDTLTDQLKVQLKSVLSGSIGRLTIELQQFLDKLDRAILPTLRAGKREVPVDVPASLAQEFQRLLDAPDLSRLVQFTSTGSFMWTDHRGPRNGYMAIFTDEFVRRAT